MGDQLKNVFREMQKTSDSEAESRPSYATMSPRRYRRLLRDVLLTVVTVSVLPLMIMTAINYIQYRQAIQVETRHPIFRLTSNNQRALAFFLQERESALRMIVHNRLVSEKCDNRQMEHVLKALQKSLSFGAFVDLGVIDSAGNQKCYTGPYQLQGKNYQGQEWFGQVMQQGIYISDVFLGYREFPHFVIAIRFQGSDGRNSILRATVDAEWLHEQLLLVGLSPASDIFIVNREGILQSPSRRYGPVLEKFPLPVPAASDRTEVVEWQDENGDALIVGHAAIQHSPFILMLAVKGAEVMGGWFKLRAEIIWFLVVSCILIFIVSLVMSRNVVRSIRRSEQARAQVFHKMQYTNKLASVGRLAAGVAHEINNPLAIISERAGLLRDRMPQIEGFPSKDKALGDIKSILRAVDRCSTITHRLLGFARHIDARREDVDLDELLHEVTVFLEKEAEYRSVDIEWKIQEGLRLKSDRGQLQQVFLNIINNALEAVEDGGHIAIAAQKLDSGSLAVIVEDNGVGISKENLRRIYEPFYTTRPGDSSGLGLSVTQGIVKKLGGDIRVESEYGKGTRFTIVLPIAAER
jgi:signal transduction histidine kinase